MRMKVGEVGSHLVIVLLDGVPSKDVIEAHEESGTALVFVRDAAGKLVQDGDGLATELRRATVVFQWPADSRYSRDGNRLLYNGQLIMEQDSTGLDITGRTPHTEG